MAATGQHDLAIEVVTAALASARLPVAERLDLLDLRANSFLALGNVASAGADIATMLITARRSSNPAFIAQALNRRAAAEIHQGHLRLALATADEALKAARKSEQPAIVATSLYRLGNAQQRLRLYKPALKSAKEAVRLFRKLQQVEGEGRAWNIVAGSSSGQGLVEEARTAGHKALELAQRCGDLFGIGSAHNILTFNEPDVAKRLRRLKDADAAFTAAGYLAQRAVVANNLGIAYFILGLDRRARRILLHALELNQRSGALALSASTNWNIAEVENRLGNVAAARRYAELSCMLWENINDQQRELYRPFIYGRIALWEHNSAEARRCFVDGVRLAEGFKQVGRQINAQIGLAEAELGLGNAADGLAATTRATAIHRARDLGKLEGLDAAHLWWLHYMANRALGNVLLARKALGIAYRLVVDQIVDVTDEGLRRNYLNKDLDNRNIVTAWLADARSRRGDLPKRIAHLQGRSSLREPFERLADTGLRLNELRNATELHEFLIDEATELSGGERVLLVLESTDGMRLAGSMVPVGEDAQALLSSIEPDLQQIRRTRAAVLDHTPANAAAIDQRSRIIAPLIAQHTLLGYLYLDIDGLFGRFHDTDRDMMAMLASQAAVALDNAHWSEALEQKVEQRTGELNARVGELEVINAIQHGISAEMNFGAIVDLVGDKLREVFATGDMGIAWYDDKANLLTSMYGYEHGRRLTLAPWHPDLARSYSSKVLVQREPLVVNSREAMNSLGMGTLPGTDAAKSIMRAPMIAGDRVIGVINVENHENANAFSEADVRLLTTVASSLGVALENARLFDETQRLLRETEQRSAELAIINAVQQALAGKLDIQGVYDAVGDKLREVFPHSLEGIRVVDRASGQMLYPYRVHEGKRVYPTPSPITEFGFSAEVIRTGRTLLANENIGELSTKLG
ncbi:MAG: GAF domain-containing protein, partial [Casimicrobiaceae bacterium]